MATYNDKPEYVSCAIQSILDQSLRNFEFLIMDDSSNEDTIEAIDSFKDRRICVLRKESKMGFVPALNVGLDAAKGKYIARMDGDDIAKPDRLKKQVQYLCRHKDVSVLGGQLEIINKHGEVTGFRKYPTNGLPLYFYTTMRNPVPHPSVMMRRKIIDEGYRYNEEQHNAEDLDLWLRLINSGHKFANLPVTTLQYRVDDDFIEKRLENGSKQDNAVISVTKRYATVKKPVFYGFSLFFCFIRGLAPSKARQVLYARENNRK